MNEKKYNKDNFFEMIRMDFVVEENLQVYLMEANMSPSVSSHHSPRRQIYYDQLLYNLFGLTGIGSRVARNSFRPLPKDTDRMLSSDPNVVINPEICQSENCRKSCHSSECRLCLKCLSSDDLKEMNNAYREFMNKGEMVRVIPGPMDRTKSLNETDLNEFTMKNQFMYQWFHGKCVMDKSWC